MGWIQQTKQASRKSGGPQYYLQGIGEPLRQMLNARGACQVWLGTPYGVVQSGLMAVAADRVLRRGRLSLGAVGHDRIQRQSAAQSVGTQIKHWFNIDTPGEPYRVDFIERTYESAFLLIPSRVRFPDGRARPLAVDPQPLTFTDNHRSACLQRQIRHLRERTDLFRWVTEQLGEVVADHTERKVQYVKEEDLLRTRGALCHLGIHLGAYRGRGYDCLESRFHFVPFPDYPCAVEIKKRSSGFDYQILKRTEPARAAVLCMTHDPDFSPPEVVDIIELQALYRYLRESASA